MNKHRKTVHNDILPRKKPVVKKDPKDAVKKAEHPKIKRVKEKKYSCEVCGAKATSMWYITRHMRLHTGEKPFVCEYPGCCYQSYRKYHLTRHHQNVHSTLRPHICEYCQYSTKIKENLRQHIISKHTTSDHFESCQFCDFKTKLMGSLRSHMRKVHKFTCKSCVWEFAEEVDLAKHLDKHQEVGILCERCPLLAKDIEELKSHSLSEHNLQLITKLIHTSRSNCRLTCETCQYQFPSTQLLDQHKSCHTANGFISCHICGHIFKEMKELICHTVVQHGFAIDAKLKRARSFQPKFCCSSCKYEFKSGVELQSHCEQHRLDGSLKCTHCSHTFLLMPDLINHSLVVHNKILDATPIRSKNVICCQICSYMFPSLSKLNAHKRKHLPDGTILCFNCPVNLSTMDEMKLHMTLMHGINIEATKKPATDDEPQTDLNKIFAISCREQMLQFQKPCNVPDRSHWCSICFYKAPTTELLSSHMAEIHSISKFLPNSTSDIMYKPLMNQLSGEVSQNSSYSINENEAFGNSYINSYIKLPLNASCASNDKMTPLHHNISDSHHIPTEATNIDELLRLEFLTTDASLSINKDHPRLIVNNIHTDNINNMVGFESAKVPVVNSCIAETISTKNEKVVDKPENVEPGDNQERSKAFPGVFV